MNIDVIIPARNEEKGIGHTIQTFTGHPCIRRVIVAVDDATTDNTMKLATFYGATVVGQYKSNNKGQTVVRGLLEATFEHVIFCDADYQGLTYQHVSQVCAMMTEVPRGLILGVPDPPAGQPGHVYWAWPWCTGFRGMPRDFVKDIPLHGYLMETQINQAAVAHQMPIVYERLHGLVSPYNITPKRRAEMERDRAYGIEKGILNA